MHIYHKRQRKFNKMASSSISTEIKPKATVVEAEFGENNNCNENKTNDSENDTQISKSLSSNETPIEKQIIESVDTLIDTQLQLNHVRKRHESNNTDELYSDELYSDEYRNFKEIGDNDYQTHRAEGEATNVNQHDNEGSSTVGLK